MEIAIDSEAVCGNCRWWMADPTAEGRVGMEDQCGACPQSYNDALDYYAATHADFECFYKYHSEESDGREGLAFEPKAGTLEDRFEKLSQVAWELFQDIESLFVRGKFRADMYSDYRDRLEAAGVQTYGFKTDEEE